MLALDARTLALPDWRGNQRLDTLCNIIRDERFKAFRYIVEARQYVETLGTC